MIVDITEDEGLAPVKGAVTMAMEHPAYPRGSVETMVFKVDRYGDLRLNTYVGIFEPTQDYGITEQL